MRAASCRLLFQFCHGPGSIEQRQAHGMVQRFHSGWRRWQGRGSAAVRCAEVLPLKQTSQQHLVVRGTTCMSLPPAVGRSVICRTVLQRLSPQNHILQVLAVHQLPTH